MAADANLIKGAAAAYGAGTAAKQAGGNQLGAVAQNLLGKVDNRTADLKKRTEEAKERDRVKQAKFNENSEAALQQGGALGEAEYDFTKRKVDALQKEYQQCTLGDDACRQKVMMALSKESQGLTSMKDTRKLNAESMLNLRGDVSAEQQEVMGIYANSQSGKYSMVEGTDGELRYTFDLGEGKEAAYTKSELDKMFEAQKDTVGTNETKKRSLANIELGKTGESFNSAQEESAFDNLTKTDNSLRSFLNDDWGVGTFAGSIEEKIQSEIGQLGAGSGKATFAYDMQKRGVMIPAAEGETNWYDNITDEDIQAIKAKLMNPETEEEIAISRQVAKEYYVDAQKQQYDKGVNEARGAMLNAQKKEANKYLFAEFKNNLAKDLDGAQTTNDMIKAQQDHLNDLEQINKKEDNLINRGDKIKAKDQKAVMDYWNNNVIPKSEEEKLEFNKQGPTDKAQHFSREIKTATGDNTINIKYSGKPFTDSSGRQVSGGYYIPQLEDVVNDKGIATGEKKQVFQLISEGDNIEATDILSFIKKGSSIASFVGNSDDLNNAGNKR